MINIQNWLNVFVITILMSTSGFAQFVPGLNTDQIYTDKKVGIGIDNPVFKLEVANNLDDYISLHQDGGFNVLRFGNISGGSRTTNWKIHDQHGIGSAQGLVFQDQSLQTILKLTQDGNVGIGTTSPSHKLTVAGDIDYSRLTKLDMLENSKAFIRAADIMFGHSTRRGSLGRVLVDAGDGAIHLNYQSDWGKTQINGGAIFLTGNTGIGTFNLAGYKLAVNGRIRAKEVKVETGWSDFVFEDDYELPTLAEVEAFIKANKHLPEIPSAKEVEENGVELGKMDSKLLQKIEELTLYIIEQHKRIEAQDKRIRQLEEANRK
ncbi:hypothetical protein QQ020_26670 [Fulvivirgaceae bacterium BMA12]|uniref:Uncharacterized protein n=1 Tax=Agaribacillus aureus TaxID=3051825 RepID=A0ABT8LG06_9BACT|nr:hypothetical protein [Fulvivirgaceae bacterium BMA12]